MVPKLEEMGSDDSPSALYISRSQWCKMVLNAATRTGISFRFRQTPAGRPYLQDSTGKPYFCDFDPYPQAGPDYPTVAVWTRGNKGNVLMAKELADPEAFTHSRGKGTQGALRTAITNALAIALANLYGDSGSYGRAVGDL